MNQKSLRYFLLAAVVLIWGTVAFRVINGLKSDDYVPAARSNVTGPNYDTPRDSFTLIANYPDPFLPGSDQSFEPDMELQNFPNENIISTDLPPAEKKPEFDLNSIQYKGMISNPETGKKLAILTIAGREYLARERDRIEAFTIRKITKDKLIILLNGKSREIVKSAG